MQYYKENRGDHTFEIFVEEDCIVYYWKWAEDHFRIERIPLKNILKGLEHLKIVNNVN